MGAKRVMRRLSFEVEIRRASAATCQQVGDSEDYLKRLQPPQLDRSWTNYCMDRMIIIRLADEDSRRPTMLGALLALLLAMISGYLVIYLAIFPDFVDMLQHSVLILVAALALLIGYTTIWVRFGAGALYRIRHESY